MMKKTFEITGSSRIMKVVMDDAARDITIQLGIRVRLQDVQRGYPKWRISR